MWERCQTDGPIGSTFGTRMHIHLGMDMSLKKYLHTRGAWGVRGVRGSSIHKSGKASKPLERSRPNLAHVYRYTREWTYYYFANQISPSRPTWLVEGAGGHKLKNVGKIPNGCADPDHIWHTYAYSPGYGHELKINHSIPMGHGG